MVVLPTPGRPKQQNAVAFIHDVIDDIDRAVNSAADAAGQANHLPAPITNSGDAMQGAGNAGPIIVVKITDAADHLVNFRLADFSVADHDFAIDKARGGWPSQVHYHFQ